MNMDLRACITHDGFAVIPRVIPTPRVREIGEDLGSALAGQSDEEGSIRSSRDRVYAARNLLRVWPRVIELAREPAVRDVVVEMLGSGCGLVRALYFDKPPGRSWSLPWHKDMTIAVRDNRVSSRCFSKPTTKAGVPHVEATEAVLENMLTARIHLDDVTSENGPLLVVPGSHRSGKAIKDPTDGSSLGGVQPILVRAGDVLFMRPLVAHSSGNSHPDTRMHRRIVHIEFAATPKLPDGYEWYDYRALQALDSQMERRF
jgi:hypothetical protein